MSASPFFMRFIERQDNQQETQEAALRTGVKAGAEGDEKPKDKKPWEKVRETHKYPSDGDEDVMRWP